jgi:hypothetical protein
MMNRRRALSFASSFAALAGTSAAAALALPSRYACAAPPIGGVPVTDWVVVPGRKEALDWAPLVRLAMQKGPVRLPADIVALNGKDVTIDGYFLPYTPDVSPVFLLTPYLAHCEFCLPNRPFSVVGVSARQATDDDGRIRSMRGRFTIAPDNPSPYPFWVVDAVPVEL